MDESDQTVTLETPVAVATEKSVAKKQKKHAHPLAESRGGVEQYIVKHKITKAILEQKIVNAISVLTKEGLSPRSATRRD